MKDKGKTRQQLVEELAELRQRVAALEALAVEREQVEKALWESEQLLQKTFASLRDAVFIIDADTVEIMDCNSAATKIFGYRREEMLGRTTAFLHVDEASLEEFRKYLYPAMAEKGFLFLPEFRMKRKDGTVFPSEHSVVPIEDDQGRCVAWVSVVQDITERKRTEEALRRRVDELAALQQTVLEITTPHELSVLLQAIVERAVALLGGTGGGLYLCDPQRQEAHCLVSYNTPRDYTGTVLKYGNGAAGLVAQSGQPLIIDDYRNWPGRSAVFEEEKPFSAVISAPMIWQGQVTGVIHVLHDAEVRRFSEADLELLTLFASHAAIAVENARLYEQIRTYAAELEQRVAERTQQLAESEARYRQLVESPLVGIWQTDAQGRFVFINQRLAEISGYTPEEAIGMSMLIPIAPELRPWLAERIQKRRAGELAPDVIEAEMVRKDGSRYTALVAPASLYDSQGRFSGFIGALIDITPRKQLEQQLARQVEEQRRLVQAMAGRELRMIELKDVIRQLRAQLEAAGLTPVADDPLAAGREHEEG